MKPRNDHPLVTLTLVVFLAACGGTAATGGGAGDPVMPSDQNSQPNTNPGADGKVRASLSGLPSDVAGVLWQVYRPVDPANPDPSVDELVVEEAVSPINPDWTFVEFDAVLPEGDYYLQVIAQDAVGNPSPSCDPVRSEVFHMTPHEQVEITLNMTCSTGNGGYIVAGVDIMLGSVIIRDIHQDRHWNRVCQAVLITTVAEDTLGGSVTIRYEFTGLPPQDLGSYATLEDHGDGTASLSAKTPGVYPIRIWAESPEGHGRDWMDVTVVFLPDETCERLEALCGQAVPVDLTGDESLPFDRYDCQGHAFEAPGVERALTFEGCGESITLVSSDPAQALVVLEETSPFGAYTGSCVAYAASGAGAVTFDSRPDTRYVLMVERAGLGTSTTIARVGCCL